MDEVSSQCTRSTRDQKPGQSAQAESNQVVFPGSLVTYVTMEEVGEGGDPRTLLLEVLQTSVLNQQGFWIANSRYLSTNHHGLKAARMNAMFSNLEV